MYHSFDSPLTLSGLATRTTQEPVKMRRLSLRQTAIASAVLTSSLLCSVCAPAHPDPANQNPPAQAPTPKLPPTLHIQSVSPPSELMVAPAMRNVRDYFVPGETVSLTAPMDGAEFDQSGLGAPGALAYLRAAGGSTWSVPAMTAVTATLSPIGIMPGGVARPARIAAAKTPAKTLKFLSIEIPQLPRGKYSVWYSVSGKTGPAKEININPILSASGQTVRVGGALVFAVRMVGPTA